MQTLLRLCFPSWAFFDQASAPPVLQIRRVSAAGPDGAWEPALVAPARTWWSVLFFPAGTQALATQSLVERYGRTLLDEDPGSAEALWLRAMVQHAAAWRVRQLGAMAGSLTGWQWRVVLPDVAEPLYESAVLSAVLP